jgi:hypothetical protein
MRAITRGYRWRTWGACRAPRTPRGGRGDGFFRYRQREIGNELDLPRQLVGCKPSANKALKLVCQVGVTGRARNDVCLDDFAANGIRHADNRDRSDCRVLPLGTAAIPVLILASTQHFSFWLGKFVPGFIAAALFVAASCAQIERPHDRWNVYRRYQRTFEAERMRYQGGVAPYDDSETRESTFREQDRRAHYRLTRRLGASPTKR